MKTRGKIRHVLFFVLTTATIVTLVLWARSSFAKLHFSHLFPDGYVTINLGYGTVDLQWQSATSQWNWTTIRQYSARLPARVFGFELWHSPGAYMRLDLTIHFGLLLLVLGSYPLFTAIAGRMRIRHRKRRNLCVDCAYNLTGNTSGVCPECGTPTVLRP